MFAVYGSEEEDNLRESLIADFQDQKAMLEVLTSDANDVRSCLVDFWLNCGLWRVDSSPG